MRRNDRFRVAKTESGPNMTPLVDVVMCILIFLMLAGSFAGASHYLRTNLPISGVRNGPMASAVAVDPLEVRIEVPDAREPYHCVITVGRYSTTDKVELGAILGGQFSNFEKLGLAPASVQVILRPDSAVPYDRLIEVYGAALNAGFPNVMFARAH